MIQVKLNSEPITFDGPMPGALDEIFLLIVKHLTQEGKMISEFLVDGKPLENEAMIKSLTDFKLVEVESLHRSDYMLTMINREIEKQEALYVMLEDYSADILSLPWDKSAPKTRAILNNVLPIVKLLEASMDIFIDLNTEWKNDSEALIKELGNVMNLFTSAIALKDVSYLSDILGSQMLSLIKQALNLLQGPIKNHFEKERPNYEAPAS